MREKLNKVKISTDRKGAIQILNTLLEKVPSGESVKYKDEFRKITQVVHFLGNNRLNLSDFLNKGKRSDFCYKEFGELEIFKIRRNMYEIRLVSAYTNKDTWKILASHYLNTKWLITTFSYEHDYTRRLMKETVEEILLLENNNGRIGSKEFSFEKALCEITKS